MSNDGQVIDTWTLADRDPVTKIVLTVAHLDHQPEHNDMTNLRHLCQRCHLHHDRDLHAANAQATRRARRAMADLFDGDSA